MLKKRCVCVASRHFRPTPEVSRKFSGSVSEALFTLWKIKTWERRTDHTAVGGGGALGLLKENKQTGNAHVSFCDEAGKEAALGLSAALCGRGLACTTGSEQSSAWKRARPQQELENIVSHRRPDKQVRGKLIFAGALTADDPPPPLPCVYSDCR